MLIVLIAVVCKVLFVLLFRALKKKFIPAADYISAVEVAKRLQNDGFTPIINLLGEHCIDREKVEQTFRQYLYLIDALHKAGIKGKVSVKPTQLGLSISKEIYCDRLWQLARRAYNQKIPLEIDMKNVKCSNDALEVLKKIPGEYSVRQAAVAYQRRISGNNFIVQTFYGVRDDLKYKWRDKGFRVEVYVPVGAWYKVLPYIWRRLTNFLTCSYTLNIK